METTIPHGASVALAPSRQALSRERPGDEVRVFALGFARDRYVVPEHAGWSRFVCAAGGAGVVRTASGIALLDASRGYGAIDSEPVEVEAVRRLDLRVVYRRPGGGPFGPVVMTPLARDLVERAVDRGWLDPDVERDARIVAVLGDELAALAPPVTAYGVVFPQVPRARRAAAICLAEPRERAWSAAELAARCGCAPRTLERLFVRETGCGVVAWQRRLRLVAAAVAIAGGSDVTSAALDAGYAGSSAFATAFRRAFGTSPSRIARPGSVTPSR